MLPSKIEDVFEEELNTFWLLTDEEKIDPKTELRRLTFRLDLLKLDQATSKSIKYLMLLCPPTHFETCILLFPI